MLLESGELAAKVVCRLMRLIRVRAVLRQLIQQAGDLPEVVGVRIEDRDAERGDLIQHALRIAAAPGEDQVRLERQHPLQVDALPGGHLLQLGGLRRVIGIGARRHQHLAHAGGIGELGGVGRQANHPLGGADRQGQPQRQQTEHRGEAQPHINRAWPGFAAWH